MELARRFNDFGLRLFAALPRGENCFVSPLGIATSLCALLPGSGGQTARELAALLGVEAAGSSERVAGLVRALTSHSETFHEWEGAGDEPRAVEREVFRLHLANALFAQAGHPLRPAYLDELRKHFGAELRAVDFGEPEPSAAEINAWVAERTEGMITDLVSPDSIGPLTRLVLANAVYFLAEWAEPFDEQRTRPQPFHLPPEAGGSPVDVPTMRETARLAYAADAELGLEVAEIPYKRMAMLVLLPRPGRFRAVEEALGLPLLERLLAQRQPRDLELELPRFELEHCATLGAVLRALGAPSAFDAAVADFGGISDHPDGLFLSEAIHRARVRVDEHGTEAAAATGLMMDLLCEPEEPPEPIPFRVDRPFFFVIRDPESGAILFLGRVLDPRP
jgi:serpin B